MKIEAVTRINFESYRKYFMFHFFQGRRSPWQARLLLAIIPVMLVAFLVLYALDPTDIFNLIGALIMAGFGFIMLYILLIMPRRYYRSVRSQIEIPNRYIFTAEHLRISQENARSGGHSEFRYEMILKASETRDSFYITIGPNQVCLIGKQDFIAGSADDLRELLQEKLRGRFSIKS